MFELKDNPYFTIDEFKCKCKKCEMPKGCPPDKLVDILCEIREHFNAPLIINSGYRCPTHNAKVGGATNSRHTKGDAVDFTIKGVKTKEVYEFCEALPYADELGLAIKHNANEFKGFVHLDTRGFKARWVYK